MLSSRRSVRMCKYGEACLKPQEILREETNIEPDHKDPEEPFSDSFVQLVAEHFWIPENKSGETSKYSTRDQHIVEVRYKEVRIMVLIIRCCHRKHNPCNPADNEVGMNASAHSIGVVKLIRPLYIVKSQLKILTPVGIEIAIVVIEKNELTDALFPIVKKW